MQVLRQHVRQLLRRQPGVLRADVTRHGRQAGLDGRGPPPMPEQHHEPLRTAVVHRDDDQRLQHADLGHARRLRGHVTDRLPRVERILQQLPRIHLHQHPAQRRGMRRTGVGLRLRGILRCRTSGIVQDGHGRVLPTSRRRRLRAGGPTVGGAPLPGPAPADRSRSRGSPDRSEIAAGDPAGAPSHPVGAGQLGPGPQPPGPVRVARPSPEPAARRSETAASRSCRACGCRSTGSVVACVAGRGRRRPRASDAPG